jgi:hypothetical protein
VRDGEHVAPVGGVQALGLERLPQELGGRLLDVGDGQRRHDRVPEEDVPVQVLDVRVARPLVADEGREAARRGSVVELLRGGLRVLPHERGLREAVGGAGAAEREARRRRRGEIGHREGLDAGGRELVDWGMASRYCWHSVES